MSSARRTAPAPPASATSRASAESGGGAHAPAILPAERMARHDQGEPSGDGGGQVGEAGDHVPVLGEQGGVDGQGGIGGPSAQEADDEQGPHDGEPGCEVLGERDQQPDGERAGQVDEQRDPGEAAAGGGMVRRQQVAGHGAERAADEDGRQRGRRQPEQAEGRARRGGRGVPPASSRRARSRRGRAPLCSWVHLLVHGPALLCRLSGAISHVVAAVRGCAPRRDPSPVGVTAAPWYSAVRPVRSARPISRAAARVRGGTGRARSPVRPRRTSTRRWCRSPRCAGRRRRRRPPR